MKLKGNEIAVIGYALRFPMAKDVNEFWNNLKLGIDCISHTNDEAGDNIVKSFGKMDGIYDFDADLFKIPEHDAVSMDPQQRWLTSLSYEALENSGHRISDNNNIGLFAGTGDFFYVWRDIFTSGIPSEDARAMKSAFLDGSATLKPSYILGLTGPSYVVKNACASGLSAVHLAVRSLLNGECDIALAGGVSIIEAQNGYQNVSGTLSGSGTVRPFDRSADGFVPGNGGGIVVLRKLSDSIRDNDTIHSIIKGTAVCNDGKRKSSYSAPSIDGEAQAIKSAVEVSGLNYDDISYIECHGTATDLGDVIEIQALKKTYCNSGRMKALHIGSVKSNVGHLNYAAGIAGLIKTSLMLENKMFVPTIYYQQENPKLDLTEGKIYVDRFCRDWNSSFRAAGVSSFGIGGADAHVVMTEYLYSENKNEHSNGYYCIPVSAQSESAVKAYVKALAHFLDNNKNVTISDAAYTLSEGREKYTYRYTFTAKDINELRAELAEPVRPVKVADKYNNSIIFMFGGSNSYKKEEVLSLLDDYKELHGYFREFSDCILEIAGISLEEIPGSERDDALFNYLLPFAVQYSLAKYLINIGIQPDAVMGYSAGEFISAVFSGVLTLRSALKLCIKRFELFEKALPGKMISVMADEENILPFLNDETEISAYNSKGRIMVSGAEKGITAFKEAIAKKDIIFVELPLERAGHCFLVEDILDDYRKILNEIEFSEPDIPFYSSLGREAEADELTSADYWVSQMRNAVRFRQQCEQVADDFDGMDITAVEIGFGEQLSVFFNKNVRKPDCSAFSIVTDKVEDRRKAFAMGLGSLWNSGYIDSTVKVLRVRGKRIPLPSYQFQYKEFRSRNHSVSVSSKNLKEVYIADGLSDSNAELLKYLAGNSKKLNIIEPYYFGVDISELNSRFEAIERSHYSDEYMCMKEIEGLSEAYDGICLSASGEYFRHYGIFLTENEVFSKEVIFGRLFVQECYIHLVELMLDYLILFGYLSYDKGIYKVMKSIAEIITIDECISKTKEQFPEFESLMELVRHCCDNYPEVLEGRKMGKEVLYPDGKYNYVYEIYQKTPSYGKAESYSAIYAEMLKAIASEKKGKLRIIELGGGSGIVTWKALKALEGSDYEYWFTDIGNTFLYQARKRIEDEKIPNVIVKRADITKRFFEQDIPECYFDIVVSCGVIQSVEDMGKAIDNMRYALRPDGVLSLLQPVGTHHIREFFGGLTPEWWSYRNDPLRKADYNISADAWRFLLREKGFSKQTVLCGDDRHLTDSIIIMGQLDPSVRKQLFNDLRTRSASAEIIQIDSFIGDSFSKLCNKCENDGIEMLCPDNIVIKEKKKEIQENKSVKQSETETRVVDTLENILGTKINSIDDSLYDYDVDSLTALMFVSRLNEMFGININPRELFYCSSIRNIADLIDNKINE